jgi:flagellar basal body-associated protein FliL
MAEPEKQTDKPVQAPQPGPNELSMDELDGLLQQEDPTFQEQMSSLKKETVEVSDDVAKLSVDAEPDVNDDTEKEKQKSKLQNTFGFLLRPIGKVQGWLRLRFRALKNRMYIVFENLKHYFRHDFPEQVKFWISQVKTFVKSIKEQFAKFMALSKMQKFAILFGVVSVAGSLFLFTKVFNPGWLPHYQDPLVRSLAIGAPKVYSVEKKEDFQDFLLAFPEVEYFILIKRVIVNFRRDPESGPNPMGAFELYIGVDSQDTAIEVKDREREIIDTIQRTLEGFSHPEASTTVGKIKMKGQIRDRINEMLNQGRVFRVYFSTFLTYN